MADHRQGLWNKGAFLRAWQMVRRAIIPPDRWNAYNMDVAAALQQAMITDVVGGTFKRTAAGTVIVIPAAAGGGAAATHALKVFDASVGTSPMIKVQAGSLTDLTNSGTAWATAGGDIIYLDDYRAGTVPFATLIPKAGSNPAHAPSLVLDPAATAVWLQCTVDDTTGFITAVQVESDTGAGMPGSSSTQCNILLSTVSVHFASGSGKASVTVNDDGAASNLFFKCCEATPLVDGGGYVLGT